MSDLPPSIRIHEEGPREGFQIEPGPIATDRKVEFIEALAETGLKQIDCVSFVNAQKVPGMADAEEVIRRVRRKPGVRYTGLWLNTKGLLRALETSVDIVGSIRVTASAPIAIGAVNSWIRKPLIPNPENSATEALAVRALLAVISWCFETTVGR